MASDDGQRQRFGAHRRRALTLQTERRRLAAEQGLLLVPFPALEELRFIDEFHYRAEELIARISAEPIG